MLLFLALMGCQPGGSDVIAGTTGPAPAMLAIDAAPAFDPARGALPWAVTGLAGATVTVAIERDGTELWTTDGTLDGTGALSGTWDPSVAPDVGPLTVVVTSGPLVGTDPSAVVQTGFDGALWTDDDGLTALRQPLYWRGDVTLQDVQLPVSTTLDGADFPAVSDDLVWVPTDGAEPVAYRFDSRPMLNLTVPDSGQGLEHATVEVTAEGWTAIEGQLQPGGTVTLQRDLPLSDTVGLTDDTLSLHFEAVDPENGERYDLGSQALPYRFYRVLGAQTTGFDVDGAQPWVAAIDPALRAIDGTVGDHDAVVDALVDWIYNDLGFVYDTAAGASFYSEYVWFNWDQPHFFLTDFIQRRNGMVINCTDSGNILATHANMIGAELLHIVILENFQLNEIKAIGIADYTSCPFGPWSCGFSYHAVTTSSPAAEKIWDNTLALDGDADPGNAPHTELLVQTITGEEYLQRLVRGGSANYDYPAQVSFE